MRKPTPLAALFVILLACGTAEPPAAGESTDSTTATPTTESQTTTMALDAQDQFPIIAPARADLAQRLRVAPEDLEVIAAEEVTWPDGSLGCPEPGMSYTQAVVEGSRVVLRLDGRIYVYHAGDDAEPFLCPSDDKDGGHDTVPPPGFNS